MPTAFEEAAVVCAVRFSRQAPVFREHLPHKGVVGFGGRDFHVVVRESQQSGGLFLNAFCQNGGGGAWISPNHSGVSRAPTTQPT